MCHLAAAQRPKCKELQQVPRNAPPIIAPMRATKIFVPPAVTRISPIKAPNMKISPCAIFNDIQHAEYQCIANRNDGIGTSQCKSVYKLLKKHNDFPFCLNKWHNEISCFSVLMEKQNRLSWKEFFHQTEKAPFPGSSSGTGALSARYHPIIILSGLYNEDAPAQKNAPICRLCCR